MKKTIVAIYCLILAAALLFRAFAYAAEERPVDCTFNSAVTAESI